MKNESITELLHLVRTQGGQDAETGALHLIIGKVLTASPLTVDVGGTTQEAARFYLCDRLRQGHTEKVTPTGMLSVTASCASGSHSSASVTGGTLTVQTAAPVLQKDDEVLLLTSDDQLFILVDKVVHL